MLKSQVLSLEEELAAVRAQLEETTKEMQRLRNILGKASTTIQMSLQPKSTDCEHVAQRENLLATLLQLMNFDSATLKNGSRKSSPILHYTPGDLGFVPGNKKRISNEPLKAGARAPLPPIKSSGPPVANPTATLTQTQNLVVMQ